MSSPRMSQGTSGLLAPTCSMLPEFAVLFHVIVISVDASAASVDLRSCRPSSLRAAFTLSPSESLCRLPFLADVWRRTRGCAQRRLFWRWGGGRLQKGTVLCVDRGDSWREKAKEGRRKSK